MKELSLGLSPCPNDTYMFYGLLKAGIGAHKYRFKPWMQDIEALNLAALQGRLDITKVSIHVAGLLMDEYVLLKTGAALGHGCGPLVVTRADMKDRPLEEMTVAIPGRHTTAALLLGLYKKPLLERAVEMPFHLIMQAVQAKEVDAGVVIHEGRFVYEQYGLIMLVDLGQWWETQTSLPVPLGGIVGRRSLGREVLLEIEECLRESILYAAKNPPGLFTFIKVHAQEMEQSVIDKHIKTYVNDFSVDLNREGQRAIETLFKMGSSAGLIPPLQKEVFIH